MSCGISVIKYILFLVNIICAIAGIALIALGALVLTQAKHLQGADVKSINIIAGIIIGLGCFIFIVAFFGCCGAIRESHCMTMTYAVVLLFLLILEIAVIAYVFITNTKGGEIFDELWKHKDAGNNQDAINAIQSFLECCGQHGPDDYPSGVLQPGCCPNLPKGVTFCVKQTHHYTDGCHPKMRQFMMKLMNYFGITISAFGAFTFLAMTFACILCSSIRNNQYYSARQY